MTNTLVIKPRALMVFIDETGNEDYSDPAFPVFGYGGCAVIEEEYNKILAKPWRQLKRERLGGAKKPFHTTDFQKSQPTRYQISGINSFVKNRFFRFAAITSIDTKRPDNMNAHKAVSVASIIKIKNIIAQSDIDSVDLVFEETQRNRNLIIQDFNPNYLDSFDIRNINNSPVEFNGYFIPKSSCVEGLEVADLIIHTAGRQERLKHKSNTSKKFQEDFIKTFHSVHEQYCEYISVDGVTQQDHL